MRRAVWVGGSHFELDESPIPEVMPGTVRVRIHACGVCMTEVHRTEGLLESIPPQVMGHEWVGTIEAAASNDPRLAVGTPVAGIGRGAFAEQIVIPAENAYSMPAGVPLDAGTFVEPLACCLAAVNAIPLRPGATALVTGAGPMGQMIAQLARQAGARVLVSEPDATRRTLALRLGAEAVIDPTRESIADAAAAFTGGNGIDIAWETAGRPAPLADCLAALRDGGAAVIVGVNPTDTQFQIPLYHFHFRNLTLHGSYGARDPSNIGAAVAKLADLDLAPLVSHRFGLADIEEAFEIARRGRGLKVLVEPTR